MNHSRIAAMVVCLTAGMVGLAQAQTSPTTTPSPAMGGTAPSLGTETQTPSNRAAMPTPGPAAQTEATEADIRQAQEQLKAQGLYKGAIDGDLGPQTKMALSQFQRRNGLPETATLDMQTRERLMGHMTSGSGSTAAPSTMAPSTTAPAPSNGASGSGLTTTPAPAKRY
ncbi:MAG TPA: peptidoglycan-binding domain-containing protein [Stellaceae bacterium]|jgi:peptidoglycan hydrolase-like protein with peptidoglycan-binding domain|nr:peptidoglycan-binding domain-containing protein [Stellaceae bacterium]